MSMPIMLRVASRISIITPKRTLLSRFKSHVSGDTRTRVGADALTLISLLVSSIADMDVEDQSNFRGAVRLYLRMRPKGAGRNLFSCAHHSRSVRRRQLFARSTGQERVCYDARRLIAAEVDGA